MRLGVWMRLGIVLTVAWLVLGTVSLTLWHLNHVQTGYESSRQLCEQLNQDLNMSENCYQQYTQNMSFDRSVYWIETFKIAVALAAIVWIIVGVIYFSARWVLAGRRRSRMKVRDKKFRVQGWDENNDIVAFETDDRERAEAMLEQFKEDLSDAIMERQRFTV